MSYFLEQINIKLCSTYGAIMQKNCLGEKHRHFVLTIAIGREKH